MSETRAAEPRGRLTRFVGRPADLVTTIVRALWHAIEDLFHDRCPQYAASIAFHVLFSLFPLTIVLVSIFGLVLQHDALRQDVIDELVSVMPVSESGQEDVARSIEEIATPLSAIGLVSLVALLWGASGMMGSIRIGLETAFKVERGRPAARAKLIDFLLVAVSGLLVLLVVGVSAFAAFFSRVLDRLAEQIGVDANPSGILLRDGIQLVSLGAMALLLYRFVPAVRPRHRDTVAGAILSAVTIWGAAKLLAIIFDFSRYNVIYGSLAGVMTFLLFVYVVALILLLGAEFAHAWSLPPGPPGPPFGARLRGFVRGLFVHDEDVVESERISETPARRP